MHNYNYPSHGVHFSIIAAENEDDHSQQAKDNQKCSGENGLICSVTYRYTIFTSLQLRKMGYLTDDEAQKWSIEIRNMGSEPFMTVERFRHTKTVLKTFPDRN